MRELVNASKRASNWWCIDGIVSDTSPGSNFDLHQLVSLQDFMQALSKLSMVFCCHHANLPDIMMS